MPSVFKGREAGDKVCDAGCCQIGETRTTPATGVRGNPRVVVVAGPAVESPIAQGQASHLSHLRSRCDCASLLSPPTPTANTRCKTPITGIACSVQMPANIRTLFKIQLRIHLLYPRLAFMIIRRCHQFTNSRLQFGLHRVKALAPVSMQITHYIYHSVPSPFPSINGHTFAFPCTTPIFQHEWLSLPFT